MAGKFLYLAHRHFRTLALIAAIAVLLLALLGFLDGSSVVK